jgi:hypothetical protein
MKKIISLVSILFVFSVWGDEQELCYSVQLLSSQKPLQNLARYPAECKQMNIALHNTLRCGCLDSKRAVKNKLQAYKKHYPNAIVVQTYRYRFHTKPKKKLQKERKRDWSVLSDIFKHSIFFTPSDTTQNSQKNLPQAIISNQTTAESLLNSQSNFYGLSLQGKYEQYLNQNYRFRDYTDYEYDLTLQFDIFKDGYFAHKKKSSIEHNQEKIRYTQMLSFVSKNSYEEQLVLLNAANAKINYEYFSKLTTLYSEALKHRMNDYADSLSTQNEIEAMQQLLNRFKKTALIYKAHAQVGFPSSFYPFLENLDRLELQDFKQILQEAKKNNPDMQLQKARYNLLKNTPTYTDNMKLNIYAHRRVVDEMGWYNTLGVEATLPLDITSHEKQKVFQLEQKSTQIAQQSSQRAIAAKLQDLYQNFQDIQKLILIDKDDIRYLKRRITRFEIIEQKSIPNLAYNPEDKILQLSQNVIKSQFQIATKKLQLFTILSTIAYLSNTSDISHLLKGLK